MSEALPPRDLARLEELFERALELPRSEQAAFVAAECGSNEALSRELQSLLDALEADDHLGALRREAPSRTGTRIGPYQLLERIGEGGMGEVYLAEQDAPIRRRVALKIIKPGMDSRQVIARFEVERQALARMTHPNIAQVFDGGTTESGSPYFVMELVEGEPITEHCDRHKLSTRERLELFLDVCSGVEHAHQKGIIHRDLKPANLLVTQRDGRALPQVIDFGVARATSGHLTQRSLQTLLGQIVGTLDYMSPEQADPSSVELDTRSDVYSLGVVLYQLLSGLLPFEHQLSVDQPLSEVQRTIREKDPPTPSTNLRRQTGTATRVAPLHGTDERTLVRQLAGDLDWICMQALEKEPARRYATVDALAQDIRRHLGGEPVSAAPPSATYRLTKFIRRNRAGVLAALLLALVLALGIAGTVWGLLRAIDAEGRAQGEATRATAAEEVALQRAAELQQVANFQAEQLGKVDAMTMGVRLRRALLDEAPEARRESLTENLAGINFTNIALGSLEQNLFKPALESIDAQFEQQPLVRAQLLQTMASVLSDVGRPERALDPQERALALREHELGPRHRDTLKSMLSMSGLLVYLGRFPEARSMVDEALDGLRRVVGEHDPVTLLAMGRLGFVLMKQGHYEEAESYYVSILEELRSTKGDGDPDTLQAMNQMALLCAAQSRLPEAESWARMAFDGTRRVFGERHLNTLRAAESLGGILYDHRKFADAATIAQEVYEGYRDLLGDEHPSTLQAMGNLGGVRLEAGDFAEAERLARAALEGSRRVFGEDHPDTLEISGNLGVLCHHLGRPREAVPYFRACWEGYGRTLGEDHPSTLRSKASLGRSYFLAGDPAEAVPLLDDVYLTSDDPVLRAWVGDYLAAALTAVGELEAARAVLMERLEEIRDTLPELSLQRADQLYQIGARLLQTKDWVEAEATLRECIQIREQAQASGWTTPSAKVSLGDSLIRQERFAEAEVQLLAGYEGLQQELATIPPVTRSSVLPSAAKTLVSLYSAWERAEPGQGHGDQALEWKAVVSQYEAGSEPK